MPETPGHNPLPRTAAEAAGAASAGIRLIGPQATRDAVLAALPGSSLAHFACHACSDPDDPAASHLLMHDGALDLADISGLRLNGAELAYLSACGTSRGSLSLAFFGINASQVEVTRSMFSHHYLGIYLTVIAIMVLGAALALGMYAHQRRDARHHMVAAPSTRWIPAREVRRGEQPARNDGDVQETARQPLRDITQ